MSERIIGLYEQNEKDLEGKFNQGATDFKLLAFEQYFNLHKENKEKKEPMLKLYRVVNKFLKTEVEDIKVLSLADFADYGKPAKIVKLFGGKVQYEQAVKELENSIYEMEVG